MTEVKETCTVCGATEQRPECGWCKWKDVSPEDLPLMGQVMTREQFVFQYSKELYDGNRPKQSRSGQGA